jgi:hypothetical protein
VTPFLLRGKWGRKRGEMQKEGGSKKGKNKEPKKWREGDKGM